MKRLNPDTGEFFKQGDIRDDCCRFWGYRKKIVKKTGYFYELWRTWDNYQKAVDNNKHRVKKFADKNPGKMAAKSMNYHAAKLKRTPPWLTEEHFEKIENMYVHAKIVEDFTGEKQHVDHIEPLQGKDRCGLHVPWNLQVLPAVENWKKGNRSAKKNTTSPISIGNHRKSQEDTKLRVVFRTGVRQNDYRFDDYSGAVRGQDIDHRTQASSGDSMGHRSEKVGTLETSESQ